MGRYIIILSVAAACQAAPAAPAAEAPPERVAVKVLYLYVPNYPDQAGTRRLVRLMKEDPTIAVQEWGGLQLPGGAGRAPFMMAIAGKTAPDIAMSWFHVIQNDVRQGFLYPLNEWIGEDADGDGQIGEDEAAWDRWKDIPKLWRRVATVNGKVYGVPLATKNYLGLIYRIDMVRAAGLDPGRPPATWDELIYWCQKLTDPSRRIPGSLVERGQRGIALQPYGWTWLPWVYSAGGTPIVQVRRSPRTGKEYVLPPDAVSFRTPEGEDLSRVPPSWRADFASPAGLAATALYHRLRWMRWLIDPETREPVNLSAEDLAAGVVTVKGRRVAFAPDDVITGVARGFMQQRGANPLELLGRGEVAMTSELVDDLPSLSQGLRLSPDLLGWCPFPAGPGPGGRQVIQLHNHFAVLCEGVGDRPKAERDKVWKVLTAGTDSSVGDDDLRQRVLAGLARFVNPADLERLGFDDYLRDVPQSTRQFYRKMADGRIFTCTEPYMGFWVTQDEALNREVLSLVMADTGERFDYARALREVEHKANSGLMFGQPRGVLDRYRTPARVVFLVLVLVMATFLLFIVKSFTRKAGGSTRQVYSGYLAWALVGPAVLLIGLWSYYPLLRGMAMALQDYRVAGESPFVGLDNFITLALDASFWASLGRTVYFVMLNMTLAFLTPIFLALLLSEVPRGKVFFRTLFFLPQVTSGLVIALLWKLMYEPTPAGFLNQLIEMANRLPLVHVAPKAWLQDPRLAMVCAVIPTVWASMGIASLIYLAALKSVPDDIYEAAEMEGAGIWAKIRHISIPTILPLILINFVGVFVATFQNMGNIFLLTFGGPGESTMVIGMRIWIEAYNNLRFSTATSMAWVMGSLLIGFTYLQIRFLRKVEFKKAAWE
jgi:multiple sugar transport system permease protein